MEPFSWALAGQDDRCARSHTMSFVVAGSNGADGRYVVDVWADPFEVFVEGDRWTVDIDELDNATWVPAEAWPPTREGGARRRMRFEPGDGLIVSLETGSYAWHPDLGVPFGDIFYTGLRLERVSKDPSTNPIPTGNPFDFSIPHGPKEE